MVVHRFGIIELDFPEKWSDQSVITLVRDEADANTRQLGRNFVITRAPFDGSYTLEELSTFHLAALRKQLPRVDVVKEETIEIDGVPAFTREVRFPTPQHGAAQQLHVFLIRGEHAFTMVGIGSAGVHFESTRDELLAIVTSFKVRSKVP